MDFIILVTLNRTILELKLWTTGIYSGVYNL
jgi:hypothetical protein